MRANANVRSASTCAAKWCVLAIVVVVALAGLGGCGAVRCVLYWFEFSEQLQLSVSVAVD